MEIEPSKGALADPSARGWAGTGNEQLPANALLETPPATRPTESLEGVCDSILAPTRVRGPRPMYRMLEQV